MTKWKRWGLILLLAGLMAAMAAPARAAEKGDVPKNIFVFGWDGAQRNHVNECLERKELPTLQMLADEGALVEIDVEGTTDTKAGWSQILTGYYPEITGVYSNGRYQPIPEGYSVPERLERHFGADEIVTFAVIGKSGHVDADPPKKVKIKEPVARPKAAQGKAAQGKAAAAKKRQQPRGKIVVEDGVRYRLIPGKPHYHMSQNIDFFKNGLRLDEKVGSLALELIEKHKDQRMFGFIHFATVDHSGHGQGENSPQYNDALISNDTWTGKIIDKLKQLGQYDQSLIYVCVDHGFDEGGKSHKNAPYVFCGSNDKQVIRNGLRQDVAPTVLERFGVDLGKIDPPLDGVPLTRPCERKNVIIGPASPHSGRQPAKKPATKKRPARKKKPAAAAQ